jgi:hypothetical protein
MKTPFGLSPPDKGLDSAIITVLNAYFAIITL